MNRKLCSIRPRRAALYLSAVLVTCLSTPSASAQCCGGSAMGGFGGEIIGDAMGMPIGPYQVMEADSIYFTVNVPEKAILQINGDPTISLGPTRYFVVRGLEPGRTYSFEIVAETANPAGVAMEEKKTIKLTPGSSEIVTMKPVKRKLPRIAPPPPLPPVIVVPVPNGVQGKSSVARDIGLDLARQ